MAKCRRSLSVWVFGAAGLACLLSFPVAAAAPQGRSGQAISPLRLDPYGDQDPMDTFQAWRRENKISLPVTPTVVDAHERWLETHLMALPGGGGQDHDPGDDPGRTITPGTNVCPGGSGNTGYQGETCIAVNPFNNQQMVAGANTFYQDPNLACQAPAGTTYGTQALYGSSDGGNTWTYNCAPWPSNDTGSVGTILFGSDPAMAWDRSGNAYAAYMLVSQNSSGTSSSASIVVAKTSTAGTTWGPLGVVVNNLSNSSVFDDKEMMTVDTSSGGSYSHPNRLFVIWDENNVERVAYSDTGATGSWTTVVLDPNKINIGGDVAIGADGTVYAVWNRLLYRGNRQNGETTVFSKSTNGGATWSTPVTVATHRLFSFGTNNLPPAQNKRGVNAFASISVDTCGTSAYKGTVYVVYNDFPSGVTSGTNLDVYLTRSTNGGSTWTSALKVNNDTGSATQFFPWCSADPANGNLSVSWYDTRNDSGNKKTQVFYAMSTNGGTSFSTNALVTQPSTQFNNSTVNYSDENSTDNANYNANQYGDYEQVSAVGGTAHIFWTDSRQFFPAFTTSPLKEDVATASVTGP